MGIIRHRWGDQSHWHWRWVRNFLLKSNGSQLDTYLVNEFLILLEQVENCLVAKLSDARRIYKIIEKKYYCFRYLHCLIFLFFKYVVTINIRVLFSNALEIFKTEQPKSSSHRETCIVIYEIMIVKLPLFERKNPWLANNLIVDMNRIRKFSTKLSLAKITLFFLASVAYY